jgi:hypothetical protein
MLEAIDYRELLKSEWPSWGYILVSHSMQGRIATRAQLFYHTPRFVSSRFRD